MDGMKLLRGLLAFPFFVAFPIALFVFVNATVAQANYANAVETSVDTLLDSDETREFVVEAAQQMLAANPELESELSELGDPESILTRALLVTSETPEFKAEVRRVTSEFAEIIRTGELTELAVDLGPAIEVSRERMRPEVSAALETQSAAVTVDLTDFEDDIRPVLDGIVDVRRTAAAAAGISLFFLLALTMTARSVAASMFFVGLPAVGVQLLILNVLRGAAEGPIEKVVVGEIVAAWNPITWAMFVSTLVAAGLFLWWKKLFRSSSTVEQTGPVGPSAPSILPVDGDYIYRG